MDKELEQIDWSLADEAFAKMSDGFIEWCQEITRINNDGDRQKVIAERYGKHQPDIARAIAIGEVNPKFITNCYKYFPASERAIYETVLAYNEHGEKIEAWLEKHPKPNGREVKEMRAALNPKKEPKTESCWVGLTSRLVKPADCKGDFTHLLRDNKEKIEKFTGATIDSRMTTAELDELVPAVELFLIDKYPDYRSDIESDTNAATEELTDKQKLERAIKKHERLADIRVEEQVRERIQGWLDYINSELDELSELRARHQAPFNVEEYKRLRSFCHPDKHPGNEAKAGECFRLIEKNEEKLCDGIIRNKTGVKFPRTVAEMMARRSA